MNHSEYVDLFRTLASLHKDILHTEESQHFARLVLTSDPFMDSRMQIREFLDKSAHVLKSPLLLISSYTTGYGDQGGDQVDKMLIGRMLILKDIRLNDFDSEEAAYTDTERIGEECLAYLAEYFSNNPQLGVLNWNQSGNEKLAGISSRNLCGTGFTVSILTNNNPHIIYNADKFLEDGL
jgi:hypothetical protein